MEAVFSSSDWCRCARPAASSLKETAHKSHEYLLSTESILRFQIYHHQWRRPNTPHQGRRRENVPVPAKNSDPGRTLALLWGPQDRPGRSGLTVRAILDAAIGLADAEGIDALSMRAIAERLGAGTMSLYTHVPGKPALIELMIDTVAGQVYSDIDEPSSRPGGWRAALAFIADRNWDLYLRHPGCCRCSASVRCWARG